MDYSLPGSSVHGLLQARENTGVDCHALLQGIFPTPGWNSCLLNCRQILSHWVTGEAPHTYIHIYTYACKCIHIHPCIYTHSPYIYTYHIAQQSSTFSVPGSGFEEDNVSMEQEWRGDGFRMILVRSTQPGSVVCEVHSRICSTMRI